MNDNLVSVILPTYNRKHTIKKALDSVLQQTYSNLEVIIIDDGSTDNTSDLIASYTDTRIHYIYSPQNNGVSVARNTGISQANGEYIAFQDSDDIWHPQKISKQINAFKKDPKTQFCYHKIQYDISYDECLILPNDDIPIENKNGMIFPQMLYSNLVPCPSLMVKSSFIQNIGLFDPSYPALEDYDYALRLSKNGSAKFIDEVLLYAGISPGGISSNSANHLLASCQLLLNYKQDYLAYDQLNHKIITILQGAEKLGLKEQFVSLLEKIMMS